MCNLAKDLFDNMKTRKAAYSAGEEQVKVSIISQPDCNYENQNSSYLVFNFDIFMWS